MATNDFADTTQQQVGSPGTLNLTFLCSFIKKFFNGNPLDLHEFIANCDSAFKFAKGPQNEFLVAYVISRITGSARAQIRHKTITDWPELKSLLLQLYSHKNHYMQFMEELCTIKQHSNENILSFYNRIDTICTRLFYCFNLQDPAERIGRIETIKELSIQRFTRHSHPDISRFLRSKEPATLSDALNLALEKERALQISCKTQATPNKNQPNFNQNSTNHSTKFCNYCKRNGHLLSECFRRNRWNSRNNNNN